MTAGMRINEAVEELRDTGFCMNQLARSPFRSMVWLGGVLAISI
jgi:hypothetical protein